MSVNEGVANSIEAYFESRFKDSKTMGFPFPFAVATLNESADVAMASSESLLISNRYECALDTAWRPSYHLCSESCT